MFTRIHNNGPQASPRHRSLVPDDIYSNRAWTDGLHSSFSLIILRPAKFSHHSLSRAKALSLRTYMSKSFHMHFSIPCTTAMPRLLSLALLLPLLIAVIGSPVRWSVRVDLAIQHIDHPASLELRNLFKRQCVPSGQKKPKWTCDGKTVSIQEFSDHIIQNGYAHGRVTMFYTQLSELHIQTFVLVFPELICLLIQIAENACRSRSAGPTITLTTSLQRIPVPMMCTKKLGMSSDFAILSNLRHTANS